MMQNRTILGSKEVLTKVKNSDNTALNSYHT